MNERKESVKEITLQFPGTPNGDQQWALDLLANNPDDQKLLLYITCFPRTTWDELFNSMSPSEADALGQRLHTLAVNVASMGEYLETRGYSGCDHNKGLDKAAKTKKKVRKALGYTYP